MQLYHSPGGRMVGWDINSRLHRTFHYPSLPSISLLDGVSLETLIVQLCGLEVKVGVVEDDTNEGSERNSNTCAD